jgi:hypothetical protein
MSASPRKRTLAPQDLWSVVRELTPAEGLALVCLATWAEHQTGLARVSDRQICSQTGVSRDVMKRLRRKLAALGIEVTPGNHVSHDSCAYDFGSLLAPGELPRLPRVPPPLPPPPSQSTSEETTSPSGPPQLSAEDLPFTPGPPPQPGPSPLPPRPGPPPRLGPPPLPFSRQPTEAPSLGAESTEGAGAKRALPWTQEFPTAEADPYAYFSVSIERSPRPPAADLVTRSGSSGAAANRDQGATPEWELTSLLPTAPVWPLDHSFTGDLVSHPVHLWDDRPNHESDPQDSSSLTEVAPRPPLPPYEQWLARR